MKERNSNFELMRIISMLFITIGHTLSWGGIVSNTSEISKFIIYIIYAMIVVHVNSFILLTGYFQSENKFKIKKIIGLIILMVSYRIILYSVAIIKGWIIYEGIKNFIFNLIPISNFSYWYLDLYIILYFLSPYLNKLISKMNKKEYSMLLIILFVFCSLTTRITLQEFLNNSDGYSLIHFVFMYLIGGYIKKYNSFEIFNKKISFFKNKNKFLVLYIILGLTKFIVNYFGTRLMIYPGIIYKIGKFLSYSFSNLVYDDPFIIIQSICYFIFFKNLNFSNKLINKLAKSANENYLFHMNRSIRSNLYLFMGLNLEYYNIWYILYAILISIVIYLISTIIFYSRQIIKKAVMKINIIKKINKKIIYGYNNIDEYINVKIE